MSKMHGKESKIWEITCVRRWAMKMKTRELQWPWRFGEACKRNSRLIWIGHEKWLDRDIWVLMAQRNRNLLAWLIIILLFERWQGFKRTYIVSYIFNLIQLRNTRSGYPASKWKCGCGNQKGNISKSIISMLVTSVKHCFHTFPSLQHKQNVRHLISTQKGFGKIKT